MTLVEFLAPLASGTHRDRVLATLYFADEHEGEPALDVVGIRDRLLRARAKGAGKVNIADILRKAGAYVDHKSAGAGARHWALTNTGKAYVRERLNLAGPGVEAKQEAASLDTLASSIPDEVTRGYVEEAVLCLVAGAPRAPIVFLWTGAMRHLQEQALSRHGAKTVTAALQKHDPKARPVRAIADFSSIKDSLTLLALREIGELDKGQWQTLNEALGLRNRCAHPTKYTPGTKRVSAFIEDVVGIVFL